MKVRKLLASTLALAALLMTVSMSNPAEAKSLRGWVNGITGRGGAGFNANASGTINAMQNTAATLDSMINSGIASGRISPSMAANFRAQLGQITAQQNNLIASGSLSASAVQSLTGQYTSLTSQVNAALSGSFGGYGYNSGYNANPSYYNGGYSSPYGLQYNTNYYGGVNNPWY